jgi:hypothetical protein
MPRESGASSTPRLLDLGCDVSGILDRPVKRADDSTGRNRSNFRSVEVMTSLSRGAPASESFKRTTLENEGAGNAGRSARPQPRAQW